MNFGILSYIIGGSFGFFLTIQYLIFFLLMLNKNEIKGSKEVSFIYNIYWFIHYFIQCFRLFILFYRKRIL